MRQILGGQGVKSHDTKLTQVLYVENGNASGIASKIADIILDKEIDFFFVHRYPLNE